MSASEPSRKRVNAISASNDALPSRKRRKGNDGSSGPNISQPNEHVPGSLTQFAYYLSDEQKSYTFHATLDDLLVRNPAVPTGTLITLGREHGMVVPVVSGGRTDKRKQRLLLIRDLQAHECTWACRVRSLDAQRAGWQPDTLPVLHSSPESSSRKQRRTAEHQRTLTTLEEDKQMWATSWPQLESEESLKEIMREHRSQTTAHALLRKPCSFCNRNELAHNLKVWSVSDLDITLLERAAQTLRVHYAQPCIQSHSIHNNQYQACPTCARCVKGRKFFKVPLYSWANGCWIGDVPPELACLTYAEELVIARAHTTKCWVKLNAGCGSPLLRQRAASGNVCIHPHEITTLATVLPRPISSLYDEIVVIFVSENQEATPEMFKRTPFLVRRGPILRALNWLKHNNPLYRDIVIDLAALAEYPADDDGHAHFPIQHQTPNDTIRGQNSTYTGHGIDTTEAIFADATAPDGPIPISVTGTFDVDNTEKSLNDRKIAALRHLKAGAAFAKTSTQSSTLSPRHNPNVYGMLWPTLFPYGVGMFEDPIRMRKESGFKPIMLKSHVRHYLQITDRRFQTHLTFPFAMHNIQMVRKSAFQSRLAVRRSWWPKAMAAMAKIDDETLATLTAAMAAKRAKKDFSKYTPSTPAEKAVFDLLRYVDYVSDHIEGSNSEVLVMREEIQAVSRCAGTISLFATLNPADTYNPLSVFTAGKDIDIDAIFGNPNSRFTSFERARSLAANPIAGAEFFKLMVDQFTNVFLGFERDCKRGIFGRVKHYYGVFEVQNRGSLHLHLVIWLEGALSPRLIHEKALVDENFKQRLFDWMESIIKLGLPADTHCVEAPTKAAKKLCLMTRPPHPDQDDFDVVWPQFLREVLDASGQVHEHNETCYKKTPFSMNHLSIEDRDRLCRFNYPFELVPESFMDENGKISMKRDHERVVGYNPVISGSFQCNTDLKFVGSGLLGYALALYMTLYAAKSDLSSPVIMSALAAAMKALENYAPLSDGEERCRKLLLKTLNQISGRRELSGQQVACALLGIGNHVTNAHFSVFHWSRLLSWISAEEFPPYAKCAVSEKLDKTSDIDNNTDEIPSNQDSNDPDECASGRDSDDLDELIDLDDTMVILNEHSTPTLNSLVYDVLFRPAALENVPMWDQFVQYEKVARSKIKSSSNKRSGNESQDDEEDEEAPSNSELCFMPGHPQIATHVIRKRKIDHIPVLSGTPIPRRDLPDQANKYAIVMLALFRPWNRSADHPLKAADTSWEQALADLLAILPKAKLDIIDHMQERWECKLAADNFSDEYKARLASFSSSKGFSSQMDSDMMDELANDVNWQMGQLDPENEGIGPEFSQDNQDHDDLETFFEPCPLRTQNMTDEVIALAGIANFYHVPIPPNNIDNILPGIATESHDNAAWERAAAANLLLAQEKAIAIDRRANQTTSTDTSEISGNSLTRYPHLHRSPMHPRLTTFAEEKEQARLRISNRHNGDTGVWDTLDEWKKIAIAISDKFTLNKKQRLAFFLKVNDRMECLLPSPDRKPFRMIIGGPGGTGKSHIYDALKAFYDELGILGELNFTAPTGVSASNIHGSTVHQVLSLRTSDSVLTKDNSAPLAALVARLQSTRTLVLDEFFFLGCDDFEKMSRNINLARGCTDDPFGNLDLILSGDEYQLTGPKGAPLFDKAYVSLHRDNCELQALNEKVRRNLTAVKNYWTIKTCVVLDEVVRQRNPRYVELLGRLRRGNCTVEGPDNDLDFLQQFRLGTPTSIVDPKFSDILRWLQSPNRGAPLITYTNHVRNTHDWLMTQAFARATGQEFAIYYAKDMVGRGRNKTLLTGQNARDAWNTPIKSLAEDLSGRLALVVGMPIFIVENIAVELGVSNGSGGTLVGVEYEVKAGRRYAISAEVDLPLYTSGDPAAEFPHRLRIPLVSKSIQYQKAKGGKLYSATRSQLPLIGGFSFTAHNSQSRSLDAATIHLESCTTIASSYVMLSRVKCGETKLTGLGILGEVNARNIQNHAPQEVRDEEKRLQRLAAETLEQAKDDLSWYLTLTGDSFD